MTVSVGVAVNMLADDTPETLINRADTGLLEAKAAGRNRVVAK
jgi:two-component system cell cycle response regulator